MPDLDDYSLLTTLREITNTPVILLVEQDAVDEVINALDLGQIDDYLTKPFLLKLLIARVKAAFRRLAPVEIAPSVTYPDAHLQIDEQTQRVSINGNFDQILFACNYQRGSAIRRPSGA